MGCCTYYYSLLQDTRSKSGGYFEWWPSQEIEILWNNTQRQDVKKKLFLVESKTWFYMEVSVQGIIAYIRGISRK